MQVISYDFVCFSNLEYVPEYSPGTDIMNCGKELIEITFENIYDLLEYREPWFLKALNDLKITEEQFRTELEEIKASIEKTISGVDAPPNVSDESLCLFASIFSHVFIVACNIAEISFNEQGKLDSLKSWLFARDLCQHVRKLVLQKPLGYRRLCHAIQKKWVRFLQSLSRYSSDIIKFFKQCKRK